MVNYILAILRYAIPHFWRKFYMIYLSGKGMVDKRDPVYQPGDDSNGLVTLRRWKATLISDQLTLLIGY